MSMVLIENPVIVADRVFATVDLDPRSNEYSVIINENIVSIPIGSILINSATNQKFIKVTGDAFAFELIESFAKDEWNWSEAGKLAFDILNDI